MKVVYVLGADEEAILQDVFKFREGEVGGIRLSRRRHAPTHGIKLPHQPGIAVPSLGRSDLLDPVVPPKSAHATESGNAAFRAHPCPGKNKDAVGGSYRKHKLAQNPMSLSGASNESLPSLRFTLARK